MMVSMKRSLDTCVSSEEEDTCMSYEEDTCKSSGGDGSSAEKAGTSRLVFWVSLLCGRASALNVAWKCEDALLH